MATPSASKSADQPASRVGKSRSFAGFTGYNRYFPSGSSRRSAICTATCYFPQDKFDSSSVSEALETFPLFLTGDTLSGWRRESIAFLGDPPTTIEYLYNEQVVI